VASSKSLSLNWKPHVAASFGSECEESPGLPHVDPIHAWWLSQLMQTKALLVDRAGLCYS